MGNGWNGRFFYNYGGGCSTGHQQGQSVSQTRSTTPSSPAVIVVLGSSLNVFNTTCNDVLSAETTSMVKEHAIENSAEARCLDRRHGGSGGSVQIQMISPELPRPA